MLTIASLGLLAPLFVQAPFSGTPAARAGAIRVPTLDVTALDDTSLDVTGPRVTEERIRAAFGDAVAAIEQHLATSLGDLPPISLVDARRAAAAIERENLPMARLRNPEAPELAQAEARQIGATAGALLTAKYSWSAKEFLVVTENWDRQRTFFPELRLTADDALRVVMVHELVHALDDRAHDFTKLLSTASSAERVDALSAVLEGHAQFVTRAVSTRAGWSDAFERVTRAIGAIPAEAADGEAQRMLLELQSQSIRFAYVDGERFVAAIDEARGAEGRAALFRMPPTDLEEVANPAWYLDPDSRPEALYDLSPAVEHFIAQYDDSIWSTSTFAPTPAQLAAGLSLLEREDVKRIRKAIRGVSMAQLYPTADPQAKVAIVAVIEFDTQASAAHFVDQMVELSRIKDETMTTGQLRITGSTNSPVERPGAAGWIFEKRMVNGTFEFEMTSADARAGKLVVETTFSGDPPPRSQVESMLQELLRKPRLVD